MKQDLGCKKITNGWICPLSNKDQVEEISTKGLDVSTIVSKNGTRSVMTDHDGNWKMTVIDYKDGDHPFVLTRDKESLQSRISGKFFIK